MFNTFGLLEEANAFIPQRHVQLIKSDISNVTKDFYFKEMLFFWTFYSSKNPEHNIS